MTFNLRSVCAIVVVAILAASAANGTAGQPVEPETEEKESLSQLGTMDLDLDTPEFEPKLNLVSVLARMAGSLLVVLGLVWGSAFLLRRWYQGEKRFGGRGRLIEVQDVVPLGGKRFVYTLKARDRLLVVGVTPENMQLLCEMDAVGEEPEADSDVEEPEDRPLEALAR